MKAVVSPSSRGVVVVDRENVFVNKKVEPFFLGTKKKSLDFRFTNLVCFLQQRKPIKPLICLSSKTQTELEIADAQIQETYHTKTIHVKFQLQKECLFGQQFLIVGDDPMFGLWDPLSAIPMNWSDGNVWNVELDIPVGKSIQFKFILKESTGDICWQPGPDRIFQTWETDNTITVCEDWADAELQKIIEEDQVSNQIEGSNVNSDMLVVTENLTYSKEESELNITKEHIAVDNVSPSQEKPKTTFSQSIIPKWPMEPHEEQTTARANVLTEERVIFPSEDSVAISNKELLVADNIFGNNGRTATVRNLNSTHIEGSLINYEEGPVLVPGLAPSPAAPTEEANKVEVEKQMSFDSPVGNFEAKDLKMPESNQEIQLDVKHEPYSDSPKAETTSVVNDTKQIFDDELKQTPDPAKEAEQSSSEPINNNMLQNNPSQAETTAMINNEKSDNVLNQTPHPDKCAEQTDSRPIKDIVHNDMQWGRKILQKFQAIFRLLSYRL